MGNSSYSNLQGTSSSCFSLPEFWKTMRRKQRIRDMKARLRRWENATTDSMLAHEEVMSMLRRRIDAILASCVRYSRLPNNLELIQVEKFDARIKSSQQVVAMCMVHTKRLLAFGSKLEQDDITGMQDEQLTAYSDQLASMATMTSHSEDVKNLEYAKFRLQADHERRTARDKARDELCDIEEVSDEEEEKKQAEVRSVSSPVPQEIAVSVFDGLMAKYQADCLHNQIVAMPDPSSRSLLSVSSPISSVRSPSSSPQPLRNSPSSARIVSL
jgi:limonene-1,2-epoxide hydrolase